MRILLPLARALARQYPGQKFRALLTKCDHFCRDGVCYVREYHLPNLGFYSTDRIPGLIFCGTCRYDWERLVDDARD